MRRDPLNDGELIGHPLQHDTFDQDRVSQDRGLLWSLLTLVLGGLITAIWIAFLLWVASEAIS
jgi:hypothetical protein